MGPMNVLVDGEPVVIERSSLAAALKAACRRADASGRIIISATADGQPLTAEELTSPSDEPTALAEVALTTADPKSLVRVTLFDAADLMDTFLAEQQDIGKQIQAGKVAEASKKLAELFAGWQSVCDVVARSSDILGENLSARVLTDETGTFTVASSLDDTKHCLGTVRDAIGTGDWALLGDVMTYELPPLTSQWRRILRALAESVGGPRGKGDGRDSEAQHH